MVAPNNPRTARVVLTVTRDTRKFINVLHMARQDNAILNSADLLAMANVVADWYQNSYRHTLRPSVVGFSVVATKQDPNDPQQQTVYINGPGDSPSVQNEAANVSMAISWRTGLAGRKYRGRFYHFGPAVSDINTNDTLTGTFLSAATSVANYLLSHAATAAINAIIYHKVGDTFTPINQVIADQNVDSQRRRLAGRGQ